MSMSVGDRFPAMRVLSTDGELDLANLWSSGPLVIAFHRMWCPFCQQAAIQLSGAASELTRLGAVTVIVYRRGPQRGGSGLHGTSHRSGLRQ